MAIVQDSRGRPSNAPCDGDMCDPVDAWYWRTVAVKELNAAQLLRPDMRDIQRAYLSDLWKQVQYSQLPLDMPVLVNRLAEISQNARDLADTVRESGGKDHIKPGQSQTPDNPINPGGDVNLDIDPDLDVKPQLNIGGGALPLLLLGGVAAVFVAVGPLRQLAKRKR